MKDKTTDNISKILAGLLFLVALWSSFDANASWKPLQDQDQSQQQEANANASANNANNQNLNIGTDVSFQGGDTVLPDDITVRNTASANAPSVYPSGNCYGGWSAGLGLPGVNLSGGKATIDSGCVKRDTARLFFAFGERDKAIMLLCSQPEVAEALPDCKPYQDYNKEMQSLKAQNELLFEDVAKTVDRLERVCSDAVTKGFEACQEK